jgi:anti-sigma regulatory factor (Ser/Thr protein kinase)
METPKNVRRKESTGKLFLETPGDGSSLGYIRSIIVDLARKVGFPEQEVARIEMAVDEACSNVVEHAYATGKEWCWQHRDPEIRLDIRTENGRLVIQINDHGQRFDFANYQPVEIEERLKQMNPSGYGIFIMRNFMDEVQYSSNDQTGNTLRLVKYLKKS